MLLLLFATMGESEPPAERQYPTKLSAVVKKPAFTGAVKPNSTYLDSSRSKVRDA